MDMECKDCGNKKEFSLGGNIIREEWLVGNKGEFIEAIEAYDAIKGDDYYCAECGSDRIN